ncbi:hypothetical protein PVK06_038105 [Gossypium arboreum]|uniref:Uncharacterized protein n=1 Tax=Gossypium arboreum TaxID=29729 RepID=A0ABR0MZ86_GOSAR|nr:hypothetical protein PVK06_038105 [Gossypium arboreum]
MVEACNDAPRWGYARRIRDGVEKQFRNYLLGIGWSKGWSELRRKKVRAINKDFDGDEGF